MHVLARELGDEHTFTLVARDYPSFTWTFNRFSDATAQVKEARIWAGIHYRNSCNVGEALGLQIRPIAHAHRECLIQCDRGLESCGLAHVLQRRKRRGMVPSDNRFQIRLGGGGLIFRPQLLHNRVEIIRARLQDVFSRRRAHLHLRLGLIENCGGTHRLGGRNTFQFL